jgi:signal transduction histidine kinase
MSRELARKLGSVDPRERLEAARHLAEHADSKQIGLIEGAIAVETVAWVTSALKRALQRARPTNSTARNLERQELSAEQTAQIYAEALKTKANQIIHEIQPILGTIRLSAESEMVNFDSSDTKRGLERMEALVAGLGRLSQAAGAPKLEDFALDQCIFAWIADEVIEMPIGVLRAGPQDTVVEGDKGLVYLAFVNGLRNAIEATLALPVEDGSYPDVTVNWGATDIDAWVAIVDAGIGFRGSLSRALEIGSTTKAGHLGMGLATAHQAITSLGGSIRLIPGAQGMRFEMRWPKAVA